MKITLIKTGVRAVERWLLVFYSPAKKGPVQRRFKSRADAERFFREHEKLRARGLPPEIAQATSSQMADIVAALEFSRREGFRLMDAAEAFVKQRDASTALHPMPASAVLVEEFLAEKRSEGCRPATLTAYASAFGSLRLRSTKALESLTRREIGDLLTSANVANSSKNNWRRHARVFFKWLKVRGYRTDDAGEGLPTYKAERHDPCIYTADESERLLREAESSAPQFVRAYALGLFCGIRPQGIARLTEADILLDDKLVRVGWAQDKTGKKYFSEIPENALAWLVRFNKEQVLAVPRYHHRRILIAAGLNHGHDILRHTFASHHLAAHQSIEKTAHALNHRGADMLFRHYRAAVKPAEGVRFFQIGPK